MKLTLGIAFAGLMALAACDSPTGMNTFITREGTTVNYTTLEAPFVVRLKAGFGAPEFWCAAGRFGEQFVPGPTRIFRLTPTPRPRGANMEFTFVAPPPGVAQPTGIAQLGGDPFSLSVFEARRLCSTIGLRFDRF